jgi:hypothetical protein
MSCAGLLMLPCPRLRGEVLSVAASFVGWAKPTGPREARPDDKLREPTVFPRVAGARPSQPRTARSTWARRSRAFAHPTAASPDRFVKQPRIIVLAAGSPARVLFWLFDCSPQMREQSAVRRKEGVPLQGAHGPILPDRPRLTALHCGVLKPWGHSTSPGYFRWHRRGCGTIYPSLRIEAGGFPRTPGTTIANRGRGRRSPFTSGTPAQTPLTRRGMRTT